MTEFSGKVEDRQAVLDEFYNEVFPQKPEPPPRSAPRTSPTVGSDAEILARAMGAKNGAKFRRLWNGDTSDYSKDSQNEADAALCKHLWFASGGDRATVERLFGQSGLGQRDKWQKRADYRQRTLDFACNGEYWKPHVVNGHATAAAPVVVPAPSRTHQRDARTETSPLPDQMQAALKDTRPKVLLPGDNRPMDEVADELGGHLADKPFYVRNREVVVLDGTDLRVAEPQEFRTLVSYYAIGLRKRRTMDGRTYIVGTSLICDEAKAILAAPQFKARLRLVVRFNRCRLPVLRADGRIELLPEGYDAPSRTLTVSNVSYDQDMSFDEGRAVINDIYGEFVFADGERSKAVAVSTVVGMFGNQLLPEGSHRPLFVVTKNAEGAGATTLVRVAVITVVGQALVGASPHNEDEMRKVITTTVREGDLYLFLDNVTERLSSASLAKFISSAAWKDRILGLNKSLTGPNLATVFATSNGATVSSDMRRRALFCELHLAEERPEDRKFARPLEEAKIHELRPRALAACWAFVRHWDEKGRPQASRSNSEFPAWAKVIGGIVQAAEYACPLDPADVAATADETAESMRLLAATMKPGRDYAFAEIVELCRSAEAFTSLVGGQMDTAATSKLGLALARYNRRWAGENFFIVDGKGHARRFRIAGLNEKVGGRNA